jgi:hypothetical protein
MKDTKIINMVHNQYMITRNDTNDHLGLYKWSSSSTLSHNSLNVHCNETDQLQNSHNNFDQYDPLTYLIIAVFPIGMLALLREVWLGGMSEIITCLLSLQETQNLQECYHSYEYRKYFSMDTVPVLTQEK